MKKYLVFFVVSYVGLYFSTEGTLPPFIKPCKSTEKDYDKCLEKSILYFVEKLPSSNVTKKVPSIDPLYIPDDTSQIKFMDFKAHIDSHDVCVRQLSQFVLTSVKTTGNSFMFNLKFPEVTLNSKIIVGLAFEGFDITQIEGIFNVSFENVGASCLLKGQIIEVNKVKTMDFKSLKIDITIVDYKSQVELKNYKIFEPMINKMMAREKRWLIDMAKKAIAKKGGEVMLNRINTYIGGLPAGELFPK